MDPWDGEDQDDAFEGATAGGGEASAGRGAGPSSTGYDSNQMEQDD